jgi:hypothetical protein
MARHGNRYGYDFGLRGFDHTVSVRREAHPPHRAAGASRPAGAYGPVRPNRVLARYNRDYVHPDRDRLPRNHVAFGGDRGERVGDLRYGYRPCLTTGGSRTWRGGSQPVGWETARRYGRDFQGPFR